MLAKVSPTPGASTRIGPTLLHLVRHEGVGALLAGVVPRTLWIGLGGAVFLGTFDAAAGVLAPQLG